MVNKIIGITGTVGAGKSTVAKTYAEIKNAYIIFTDNVAKELQQRGNTCYNLIVDHFGEEIVGTDKEIDRKKLAEIVFSNEKELAKLNSFVHKEVVNKVKNIIEQYSLENDGSLILIESAILFQVDELVSLCDEIWYIDADDKDRRERLKRERNYSDERIEAVMNSQKDIHLVKDKCDKVIVNNKDIVKLKEFLSNL